METGQLGDWDSGPGERQADPCNEQEQPLYGSGDRENGHRAG
jgi:hypothetical protein